MKRFGRVDRLKRFVPRKSQTTERFPLALPTAFYPVFPVEEAPRAVPCP